MKTRVVSLDIARGLSVIWIVGILHVIGFVVSPESFPEWLLKMIEGLTKSCLATFTYLSGYFVAGRRMSSGKEVYKFFKKRIIRFAVLYFVACILLYFAGIVLSNDVRWFRSINQLVATLIGVSGLIPNFQPATFWYFSMIILFYLFTPYISFAKSNIQKIIRCLIVLSCLLFETVIVGADTRLPFYFIFYACGAFNQSLRILNVKETLIALIIFIPLILIQNLEYYLSVQNLIVSILGMGLILSFSYKISSPKLISFLSFIAYGSMCAYLYHRHLYALIKKMYKGEYWPVYIWPIAVIVVFLMGYAIQSIYDRSLKK